MPSFEHPMLILVAVAACVAAAFPLNRFFFGDYDGDGSFGMRKWGLLGMLVITFLAVYSLAYRIFGPG
jgi:hypothetical protein